jgi:hypothetical protein
MAWQKAWSEEKAKIKLNIYYHGWIMPGRDGTGPLGTGPCGKGGHACRRAKPSMEEKAMEKGHKDTKTGHER